ncbi:ATP-binding protein [Salinicoccus sp. ID82-1]|uniref:HAMP domain-containing sensor histidine kinase n=1 Tax=Salinicoccus sp. ID82-1 TaxID=2820269 RepID=UPI00351D3C9B
MMRSLYSTFAATTIGIMLTSFLVAFLISNAYYQQYLKPVNDEKNTRIAQEISTFIEENPEIAMDEYLKNIADIGYQIYLFETMQNGILYGAEFRENELSISIVQDVLDGNIYHGMREFPRETFVTGFFANELENTIGVPVNYDGGNYAIFIRPDIQMLFNEMHLLFGWLFLITIILSIILVLIATKYMVRPVSRLSRATKILSSGNYNVEGLETGRKDEMGELTNNFVKMAEKIRQNENMRKDFISNISHDIQSPLSNIKGYGMLLKNELVENEKGLEYVRIIDDESNRISSMTNQLLLLSSLDQEAHILKVEEYNVGRQIRQLIHNYEWKIDSNNLMLSHDIPDVEITADQALMNTVWDNLISNALKYNSTFGEIEIELMECDKEMKVSFKDTGIGMDDAVKQRIFEKFYREDTARSHRVPGSGLGLSIVHKVISLHEGTICVESNQNGQGSIFTVTLPKK